MAHLWVENNAVLSVAVDEAGQLVGTPQKWVDEISYNPCRREANYDVHPKEDRLLFFRSDPSSEITPSVVVLNWLETVKQAVSLN